MDQLDQDRTSSRRHAEALAKKLSKKAAECDKLNSKFSRYTRCYKIGSCKIEI